MDSLPEITPDKDPNRREALEAVAKVATYLAPATLLLLSSKDSFGGY